MPKSAGKDSRKSSSKVTDFDPSLVSLFDSSFGPVDLSGRGKPALLKPRNCPPSAKYEQAAGKSSATLLKTDLTDGHTEIDPPTSSDELNDGRIEPQTNSRKRKRQHGKEKDQIEEQYMKRLAKEESRNNQNTDKPSILIANDDGAGPDGGLISRDLLDGEGIRAELAHDEVPKHESSLGQQSDAEIEKSQRTCFLSNVCSSAIESKSARRVLLEHMSSFIPLLPQTEAKASIESIRFRSVAFASTSVPKRAAYATKELMDATTKATNAYVVFSSQYASREACKRLNGTIVLDRHLRVDSVAHPAKNDHRRCVFVGNLGFVNDESGAGVELEESSRPKSVKKRQPADTEEGLWREFGKVGTVENVRVIRDKSTRVGKGIAYVQFTDEHAVEKALRLDGKKFPPLLPRPLRVTRARKVQKGKPAAAVVKQTTQSPRRRKPDVDGRTKKLLGSAGASNVRRDQSRGGRTLKKASTSCTKRAKQYKAQARGK